MNWLNILIADLRSPPFMGSNPTERATWLCVLAYACEQETGGVISGGNTWKDRQWQQCCGVTLREVRGATKLLEVRGDDVVVFGYPVDKEEEVQKKRSGGRQGGLLSAASRAASRALRTPSSTPCPSASSCEPSSFQADDERKGMEGKGMEGNGSGIGKESFECASGTTARGELGLTEPEHTHTDFPEVAIPSVQEVIDYGKGGAGIPEDYCRHFWTECQSKNLWSKNGRAVKWRLWITGQTWWGKDRATWGQKGPNGQAVPPSKIDYSKGF